MATGFYLLDHPNRVQQYGKVRRGGNKPTGTIIIHTAENVADQIGADLGAESVARYCTTRGDYGAYHRLVDADSIIKMAPLGYETWHCTKTNPWSVGISMAVEAGDWTKYPADYVTKVLRNAARAAADAVRDFKTEFGIDVPIAHISGDAARAKKPGFTGHGETDPGRRTDPGANFPWTRFLAMVREELDPTPPKKEDGFMSDLTDKEQHELLDKVRDLHDQFHGLQVEMPWTDKKTGKAAKYTFRSALKWAVAQLPKIAQKLGV
ncbi:N-acetylmuramoyl-L-alanine amidase [Promicromonospora thailandica]|uniref:N-acetylmuramoyl-L-alanine amidase n=1 Tax=Promicromonospora thailandica TaxID=765201 RepID=A0A9X2G1Z7_9MICO|nr:N-acetylmuramoyl-L-alanine amidase [Promicromonospora thailandica]MCP2265582.1 N-acetylmuramoyl-L-alanine amidase [Promicromonospora thailandica]